MILRLLGVLLVLLALHGGYTLASPAIKNGLLEGKMKDLVKERGLKGERELMRDTLAFAREKGIPIDENNIVVRMDNYGVSIAARYETDVDLWGVYTRHYEFYPTTAPEASLAPSGLRRASAR